MQTKLIDKQATSAKFEVTVPAAEVDQTFGRVLQAIARQVRVPGFRPGKAPRGVLVKRVGEDAFHQEVRDALVERNYPKAVQELELMPVHAHFHAQEPSEGQDYTFEVHVDLYPEVGLPDLEEIIVDTAAQPLTDDMVEAAVAELQREQATLVPVERPVEAGDYVLVETLNEGEASGNVLPIDLERVEPELAEQLVGKAAGDDVTLRFGPGGDPADEGEGDETEGEEEAAAPQPQSSLTVRVKEIKAKEKPELDDDFAATLGFGTWDEVLEQVRRNLRAQLDADAFEAQREEFVDKLVAETDFEVPATLVNRRKGSMLQSLAADLKERGLTLEGYLANLAEKGERESFDADLQERAEAAVRRDLVLERLLEERGTEVSDEEFADALRYMAARQGKDAARFRSEMGEEWLDNYRYLLRRDKALREVVRERLGVTEDEAGEPAEEPTDDEGGSEGEAADESESAPEDEQA